MNVILLSGGSGKRLWPLSNDVRSKQFIRLFRDEAGQYESMLQRMCRQIWQTDEASTITVATGKNQKSAVKNQLGDRVGLCTEPSRRDTFPAIALAAAYMYSEKGLSPDEVVIVCPVDPYVELDYFETLKRLEQAAKTEGASLTLMGATPTYPSAKYGYIIPEATAAPVKKVHSFKEKPDEETAAGYIGQGALWNCGVFAFRLGYMLTILHRYMEQDGYGDVYANYDKLPKTSFDYEVVEKEPSIKCIEYAGAWKDVGTWTTFSEVMSVPVIGNAVVGDACERLSIVNELDIPILAMGCRDMVIAASPDGILVSDRERTAHIKPYVDKLDQRVMYEEKSWGQFQVLSLDGHAMTVHISIRAGKSMSYHCHTSRDEIWTVLSGKGVATLEGVEKTVSAGDVLRLPAGQRHTLVALTDMEIIEIQLGEAIDDNDTEVGRR